MYWNGASGFASPTYADMPDDLLGFVETGDVDADGYTDAIALRATSGQTTGGIVIARGQQSGQLATPIIIPATFDPSSLHAAADMNGDGIPEIVVTDTGAQRVHVYVSNP